MTTTTNEDHEIVVLTGAAGCLGHHTLRLLISSDDKVREIRCLDLREPEDLMKKLIEEEQEKFRTKNAAVSGGKREEKRIKWIKGDVRDINLVEQTLTGADCVIHCAAKIDVWTETGDQDAEELESINVTGTEILLKASIQLGVPKFIHVSSFEVFVGFDTIYYATENTLPDTNWLMFGPSASTKKEAENKVRQYSNNKLLRPARRSGAHNDSLNAVIIRFSTMYGEFDRHYVSKILELTKFLGGSLRRLDFVWIRQQPIYVGNAAWSLLKAKQRMDKDQSISGEEFHITDETAIGDPFDFVEPYLECRGMRVTKGSYSFLPLWLLLYCFFTLRRLFKAVDFLGLFTNKRGRLEEAIERDKMANNGHKCPESTKETIRLRRRWYDYVMPQTMGYMCNSNFLNRTKASLRLDYDPVIGPEESKKLSMNWYANHLKL